MTILARLNKRNQHLADVLVSRAKKEHVVVKNWFFKEGKKEGPAPLAHLFE